MDAIWCLGTICLHVSLRIFSSEILSLLLPSHRAITKILHLLMAAVPCRVILQVMITTITVIIMVTVDYQP